MATLVQFCSTSVVLTCCVAVLLSLYLFSFVRWHYWKRRGVPYLRPLFPILGNMYDLLFFRSLPDIANRIYNQTKHLPFIGIYAFHTPVLVVNDLDLIGKILINDFNHFEDRGFKFNSDDPLGRNLIHQTGPDWKFSRTKLTPCFNISKVKSMLPTMKKKSEVLVKQLEKEQLCKNNIETWDISLRYTTDVIALCTMGVEANTLQNQDDQFREAGKNMLGVYFIYHVFTACFLPKLHKFLRTSVAKPKVTKFFRTVISQVMDYRNNNNSDPNDFISTLMQLKEIDSRNRLDMSIPEIDDNFIFGQVFIFFLGGYESPGNALACALYQIAKNPKIQETLITEIRDVLQAHNGEASFEALQSMKYLRQVLSETLRMYTPLTLIFRRCTKDYTLPGTDTVIEKGTLVLIPLRSIHMDPELYSEPQLFNPERFSDENTAERHIAAFMPFGIGPRICPAVLYSHMKMRTALVNILQNFKVCLTEETPDCLEASAADFLMAPKNGIPLKFVRRNGSVQI